jgi:hypothetical protein
MTWFAALGWIEAGLRRHLAEAGIAVACACAAREMRDRSNAYPLELWSGPAVAMLV